MKAIFAGAFDPITKGHLDIISRAIAVFGSVTVAVAEQTEKNSLPLAVRKQIAETAVRSLNGANVETFSGALCNFVADQGDCVLVRGVRGAADLEYERDHARIYNSLCGVETVLICSAPELEHVSSSVVRALARLDCDLSSYLAPGTEKLIRQWYGKNREGV